MAERKNQVAIPKELKPVNPDLEDCFSEFKACVTRKALVILTDIIPSKMRQYNDACPVNATTGEVTDMKDFPGTDDIYRVPDIQIETDEQNAPVSKRLRTDNVSRTGNVMKLPEYIYTAKALTNSKIGQQMEEKKKEAGVLLELVAHVKLWVQLNVPKIEDGNNFGVAIQEDVIHELSRVEEAAFNLRDTTSKFFLQRAKIVTKILKYPNVEDYRLSLRELDERQWFQMKVTDMDTRNNYAIIYDLLYKNWHKVIKPRSSDGSTMIY